MPACIRHAAWRVHTMTAAPRVTADHRTDDAKRSSNAIRESGISIETSGATALRGIPLYNGNREGHDHRDDDIRMAQTGPFADSLRLLSLRGREKHRAQMETLQRDSEELRPARRKRAREALA